MSVQAHKYGLTASHTVEAGAASVDNGKTPEGAGGLARLLKSRPNEKSAPESGSHLSNGDTNTTSQKDSVGGGSLKVMMMMKKKMKKWRMGRQSEWSFGSGSRVGKNGGRVAHENTYQLDPVDSTKFSDGKVEEVIKRVLENNLSLQEKYHPAKFSQLSKVMSEEIKSKVKDLGYQRYKIVAHVLLGEKRDQSVSMVSRSVWNTDTDNIASFTFAKNDFFAIGVVYGTYFE